MSDRAPAYQAPVLHFNAALREGGRTEGSLATKNERKWLYAAPAHVHPAHAAHFCWSKLVAHS